MKILLFLTLFVSGCKLTDNIAQRSLYPFDWVNKNYPIVAPYEGVKEAVLHERTHLIYGGEGSTVILYFHGNGENLTVMQMVGMHKALENFGQYVIPDYPGLGKSTGEVSQAGLMQNAIDAYEFAKTLAPNVVVWGRSLGAAVAAHLAVSSDVQQLILTSPWTSFKQAALDRSAIGRIVSKSWYLKNKWDNSEIAPQFQGDVLILHGTKDELVLFKRGQQLANAFLRAHFVAIDGADHNNIFQYDALWDSILNFID